MPHKCLDCNNIVEDGSDQLLDGCPNCDNQSWEYINNNEELNEEKVQHEARTEMVSVDEVFEKITGDSENKEKKKINDINDTIQDISKIQSELQDQYGDAIEIVDQDKYIVDIMKLYHGEKYIIKIGEDGSYTVENSSAIDI